MLFTVTLCCSPQTRTCWKCVSDSELCSRGSPARSGPRLPSDPAPARHLSSSYTEARCCRPQVWGSVLCPQPSLPGSYLLEAHLLEMGSAQRPQPCSIAHFPLFSPQKGFQDGGCQACLCTCGIHSVGELGCTLLKNLRERPGIKDVGFQKKMGSASASL